MDKDNIYDRKVSKNYLIYIFPQRIAKAIFQRLAVKSKYPSSPGQNSSFSNILPIHVQNIVSRIISSKMGPKEKFSIFLW